MSSPNQDPRLLSSVTAAKASDVEARLVQHIETHPAAPPSLVYGQTSGQASQTANGTYTWTCPAGVFTAKIECIGAGAGGGGGSGAKGGEGGGGGEYACEPAYPLVPGQVYTYFVGNGGSGGTTGYGGQNGGDTIFDTGGIGLANGVFANGGLAGTGFTGGPGGGSGFGNALNNPSGNQPSLNSIHQPGGSGGGANNQGTGGCGGGGGGGSTSAGAPGGTSGGSGGASGGAGGGGGAGGAGGAGGNNAANGVSSVQSGGAGGGAGASTSATTGQSQYRLNNSASYYGADASGGNANQWRSGAGGTMWQGGETASGGSYNGTQKALGVIGGNSQADLTGKTIDQVTIRLQWTHTWYNNGAYVNLAYTSRTSTPLSWDGTGRTGIKNWWQGSVGSPVTTDLTLLGFGAALANGTAQSISIGPGSGAFNLNWYGSMYGAGGSNNANPLITVNWHTGSAPTQAGAGCDGKVIISYTVTGILQAALQPATGTDAGGNAFNAGYTGPTAAIQPASSPSVVESWHAIATDAGWSAPAGYSIPQYRLLPDGNLQLAGASQRSGTVTSSIALNSSSPLPAAYRPNNTRLFRCFNAQGLRGAVQIDSTGVITMLANSGAAAQVCEIDAVLKIN